MSDQELRRTLEELHRELQAVGQLDQVDDELERLLQEIRTDIENVMERSEPQGLGDRLGQAIERFEATHPRLASAMGAVADQLARMGV